VSDVFALDGFTLRRLERGDVDRLLDLFERCADHFVLHDGEPPGPDAAAIEFDDLPPGRAPADKHLHGLAGDADPEHLVAVLESVTGYPDDSTWFLGLLLVDPAFRGRGVGAAMVAWFEATVAAAGFTAVRLAVIGPNVVGRRFWERCGFRWEATHERRPFGRLVHDVDVMVHRLAT
jgi:GNAT superfamily N-acetyltransferase